MRPICPVCGEKHFAREPHVFKDEVKPLNEVLRVRVVTAVVTPPETKPVVVTRHGKYRDETKRAEYLRNYMRTKRAVKSGRAEFIRRNDGEANNVAA